MKGDLFVFKEAIHDLFDLDTVKMLEDMKEHLG